MLRFSYGGIYFPIIGWKYGWKNREGEDGGNTLSDKVSRRLFPSCEAYRQEWWREGFYVTYKKDGKTIEEKVGRQYADDMTAAKASAYRSSVVEGRIASRQERRKVEQKQAEMVQTIGELWDAYAEYLQDKASFRTDKSNFKNYLAFFFQA